MDPSNGKLLLEIEGVSAGYGPITVLKGISVHVRENDFVALIGPNGAGKTTLFRTVTGLLKARTGRLQFADADISRAQPKAILRMGLSCVAQDRSVFPDMTVLENLDMGAYISSNRAEIAQKLEQAFTMFPVLAERRRQRAGTLSGGEQRMLEIARALMLSPKLLLLDEPSLGLSPILVKLIFQRIRELNETGMAVLLIEQNGYRALEVARRGYVMDLGRIVLEDTSENLLGNQQVRKLYLGA